MDYKAFKIWGLFLVLWTNAVLILAQGNNIGTPFTRNFASKAYEAGTQNWSICQHPNGMLFFANNNGLLQYDGTKWNVFPLDNKTIARAVFYHESGKIYVGGQNEFGYFIPDEKGQLNFHSLTNLIPEEFRSFEDVWEIVSLGDRIFFRSSQKVYVIEGEKAAVFTFEKNIDFMGSVGEDLYVYTIDKGLSILTNNQFQFLPNTEGLVGFTVRSLFSGSDDNILIATLKNGIFEYKQGQLQRWKTDDDEYLKTHRIYTGLPISDGRIALGTTTDGLLILDQQGRFLYHLNRKNGLQNNNILSLFLDQKNNLWLGLDNGIDYVQINSAFSKVIPNPDLEGSGYTVKIYQGKVYFGTSDGLYVREWSDYFDPMKESSEGFETVLQGQVWGTSIVNDRLFVGQHEGAFAQMKNGKFAQVSENGSWIFVPFKEDQILAGSYFGLSKISTLNQGTPGNQILEGLNESSRFLEYEKDGVYWVSHPYRGIYKVEFDESLQKIKGVKLYNQQNGLPSENLNHVFKINDELVFTGEQGVFKFDEGNDQFVPHEELQNLLGEHTNLLRFFEDRVGNIWFVSTNGIGRLSLNDKGVSKQFTKEIYTELDGQLLRGFEMIYPYDENNVFIGAENGFIHFNPSVAIQKNENFVTLIHDVIVEANDQERENYKYTANLQAFDTTLVFSNFYNAFSFRFSAPYFQLPNQILYQTRLQGQEEQWSAWSLKTDKEYNNLSAGDYTFQVRAKNKFGEVSEAASFAFNIKPPWYATTTARLIYGLLILALLIALVAIPRRQYKETTEQLKSEHQKVVAQSEQEITELKNKNLEAEVAYHKKELASTTMHLVQKSELILKLKSELQSISKQTSDPSTSKTIKDISKLLNPDEQLNDNWSQFAFHFDQVHSDFLKRLQKEYPQLSSNDYKLCTYLRMNLSTKEIVPLMNISVRGVEVARYRLRKKIELDSQVNLNEFMMKF